MKKNIRKVFCLILALSMILLLAGCKKSPDETETADAASEDSEVTMEDVMEKEQEEAEVDYDNGIYFDEEDDGAEIVAKKKTFNDYVGSWTATSGQALYQYGNVDITVKADGRWTGNISEEDLSGKWTETDDGIHLTSDIFDCDLVFTADDVLVMRYSPDDDGEYITTVLSEK